MRGTVSMPGFSELGRGGLTGGLIDGLIHDVANGVADGADGMVQLIAVAAKWGHENQCVEDGPGEEFVLTGGEADVFSNSILGRE